MPDPALFGHREGRSGSSWSDQGQSYSGELYLDRLSGRSDLHGRDLRYVRRPGLVPEGKSYRVSATITGLSGTMNVTLDVLV